MSGISIHHFVTMARNLLGQADGHGESNPEYERAMVELVRETLGYEPEADDLVRLALGLGTDEVSLAKPETPSLVKAEGEQVFINLTNTADGPIMNIQSAEGDHPLLLPVRMGADEATLIGNVQLEGTAYPLVVLPSDRTDGSNESGLIEVSRFRVGTVITNGFGNRNLTVASINKLGDDRMEIHWSRDGVPSRQTVYWNNTKLNVVSL